MAGEDASGGKKRGGGRPWRGAQGDGKRHKGALGAAAAAKGSGGVLVTCDKTKERQSVRDALNLLNEAADKYFPVQEAQAAGEGEDASEGVEKEAASSHKSVQEMLAAEVAALQEDAKQRRTGRFTALDTGVKGAVLIQCLDPAVSPVALVGKVLAEVEQTKEFSSRFISRMIPLERVGYSATEEIREMARPLVLAHVEAYKQRFAGESEVPPLEYAVEIKRRNCTGLKTMDVINALVDLVGPEHKVNLTSPASVILVEVFRSTCGVSVVTDFHRFKKYNVRSIIDPPVSTKPNDDTLSTDGTKDGNAKEEGAKEAETGKNVEKEAEKEEEGESGAKEED